MSFYVMLCPKFLTSFCHWQQALSVERLRDVPEHPSVHVHVPLQLLQEGRQARDLRHWGNHASEHKKPSSGEITSMKFNFWCFPTLVAPWPSLSRTDRSSTGGLRRWICNNKVSLNQFLNSWGHSWGGSLPFKSFNTGLWAEFKLTDPWLPKFQTLKIVNLCRFSHPLLVFRIIIPDSCEILVFRKSLRLFPNLRQLAISPQNLSEKLLENICEYFIWTKHDLRLSCLFSKVFGDCLFHQSINFWMFC